ncbi:MAG: hypothetical protein H8E37_05970 [Planctomycetes bacterium]|nr:hypothetical protein [Planctomycetota bacterium]
MRGFSTLLAVAGLLLMTGCEYEQREAGSSTSVVSIDDSDEACCCEEVFDEPPCCAQEVFDEPTPEPVETPDYEPAPIASADDGTSENEI